MELLKKVLILGGGKMDKMFVEVYQQGRCVNVWNSQIMIVENLLFHFFTDKTVKGKNIKIKKLKVNNYNEQNDESTGIIEIDTWFYDCNNEKAITTYVFNNIPLKYGVLDTCRLNKLLENDK